MAAGPFQSVCRLLTAVRLVTLLLGGVTTVLVGRQVVYALQPKAELVSSKMTEQAYRSLAIQAQRIKLYRQHPDPVERELIGLPPLSMARNMDRNLPPDTRIFMNGVLGAGNSDGNTMYYFMRHYLFPREMEISLDRRVVQTPHGFEGVPCDSPEELQKRGYDILLQIGPNHSVQVISLTGKGQFHE